MKSANIPPLRVIPELRADVGSVLRDGESLIGFAEEALRRQIDYRRMQADFLERGLVWRAAAKASGEYSSQQEVTDSLRLMLQRTKQVG